VRTTKSQHHARNRETRGSGKNVKNRNITERKNERTRTIERRGENGEQEGRWRKEVEREIEEEEEEEEEGGGGY
jgi:hypothetical protein